MARWGLQVNRDGTYFIRTNFNPRVCFAITFSHTVVRAGVRKTDFRRG